MGVLLHVACDGENCRNCWTLRGFDALCPKNCRRFEELVGWVILGSLALCPECSVKPERAQGKVVRLDAVER